MVQWKGSIEKQEAGEKVANLESIEQFEVPNFFVLTKSEIDEFLDTEDPRRIANAQIPESVVEEVKDAYQDVGMSSEVRNASGQARDLVGNQRESQRVSVRISSTQNGSEYQLNVGASGLEEAIRKVLSSYYSENSETPAILFQKMIEPEYTGAVIQNYTPQHSLIEIVEGLGHSLEEGITVPEFYLLQNNSVKDTRVPEKQVKVSRNPMNGQRRTRTISKNSNTFQNSEIEDLARKVSREGLSVKFVYKRGSFYAVDAFKDNPIRETPDLEALKVSEGEIKGRKGEDYILSDEPRQTKKPLVSRKGGYTTSHSQEKRKKRVPAVVSLKNMDKIDESNQSNERRRQETDNREPQTHTSTKNSGSLEVTATEVRSIEEFPQLSGNPFNFQDSESKFADNCEEILSEESQFIDGRSINQDALESCLEYLEDVRIVAVQDLTEELLKKAVENGLEAIAVPRNKVEEVSQRLLRKEKRFIMDNIRN